MFSQALGTLIHFRALLFVVTLERFERLYENSPSRCDIVDRTRTVASFERTVFVAFEKDQASGLLDVNFLNNTHVNQTPLR